MKTLEIRENQRNFKGAAFISAAKHSKVFKLGTKLMLKH